MIENMIGRLILLATVVMGLAAAGAFTIKLTDASVEGAYAVLAATAALGSLFGLWLLGVGEEKRDRPSGSRSART